MSGNEEKKNENSGGVNEFQQVIRDAEEIALKYLEMMEKSPNPMSHALARAFIDISIAKLLYYIGIPEKERKTIDAGQKNLDVESIPFIITILSLELAWLVAYYRFNYKLSILSCEIRGWSSRNQQLHYS